MEPTWGAIIIYVVLGTICMILAAVLINACCPIDDNKVYDEIPFRPGKAVKGYKYTPYTGEKTGTGYEWLLYEVRR